MRVGAAARRAREGKRRSVSPRTREPRDAGPRASSMATVAVELQTILLLPYKTGRNDFCIFKNWSHRLLYTVASSYVKNPLFVPSQSHRLLKLTSEREIQRSHCLD